MRCKNCGAELPDNAYFCSECGELTNMDNPEKTQNNYVNDINTPPEYNRSQSCPNCGSPIKENDDFCPQCGTRLNQKPYTPDSSGSGTGSKKILIALIVVLSVIVIAAVAVATAAVYNSQLTPTPTPEPTPRVTSVPLSTPTPTPTPTPIPVPKSRYEVVVSHISWAQAKAAAERKGGHLVTIQNQAEFNEVTSLLAGYSTVKNVWVGTCAPENVNSKSSAEAYWNSSDARWITGERFEFKKWRSGEPSGYDSGLAAPERYLQIFRPAKDGGAWSYNDAGDDLSEYKENTLAYVIEYE